MGIYDSVVITGGNGMLGHALTDALCNRGVRPVVLSKAECDLADPDAVGRVFDHRPTLVLNCAAHTKVDLCESQQDMANRVNGYAVGELATLCRQNDAKLVHVSTDFVFNGKGTRPYRIDDPTGPLSAYGRSKLLGETLAREAAPDHTIIVRTAWVYGRYGANFPRTMVTAARAGKSLSVVDDQVGSPTYTSDLAAAILALTDAEATGTFHATNSGTTNWADFARAALATFGLDQSVAGISSADWEKLRPSTAVRPSYSVLDLQPFTAATGHTMRPWQEALEAFRSEVVAAGGF